MASAKENVFILTPLNFKEGNVNSAEKFSNITENIEKYDPLVFCRTCARMDHSLVPIFKEEGLDYSLSKKIEKYLPIQVSEGDELSVHLCYYCASTLIAWENLIGGCIEAEKKLTLLKNSAAEKQQGVVVGDIESLINETTDSDDGLLVKNESLPRTCKNEEKRDILQEKNDQTVEVVDIQSERRRKRKVSLGKTRKVSSDWDEGAECHDENKKASRRRGKSLAVWSLRRRTKTRVSVGPNEPYRCPICWRVFADVMLFSEDLYSHLSRDLVEGSDAWDWDVCKVCKAKCDVAERLPEHILLHVDVVRGSGEGTGRGFVRRKKGGKEEEVSKLSCEICGKVVSKKYALKRHLATHSREKKFTCHHCGKQYAQESGLQRHVLVIHEGVRKYKCPICSEVFSSNSELKSHQYTHTDPRPFQCDQCGRTFVSHKHLYHHRKYHHTANGMRQLCTICNRYFSSPSVLKRHHKVIHLGLKEFQCHVCSAQLTTKHYLQEHLRLHSDERPEVCSFCGKAFQVSGNLKQHLKTHMGKTQICYVCGKGFTRRCHLVVHMNSHRGFERPQCEHCSQVFLLKGDLEKHLKKDHGGKVSDSGTGSASKGGCVL